MQEKRDYIKGISLVALSGLCYGLIGYFGMSIIYSGMSIYTMLFWRYFGATLFMSIFLLPEIRSIKLNILKNQDLIESFLYGALLYAPSSTLYFLGSEYLGSGLSMVVFFIYPSIVILINYFLYGIKVAKLYYFFLSIIILGMFCLVNEGEILTDFTGIFLNIISAAFYALYVILNKRSKSKVVHSTLAVCLGCSFTCFIGSLFDKSFVHIENIDLLLKIIALSTISTAIPILLLLKGIKYIDTEKAATLGALEPIFVVIFGNILLHEEITMLQILGIIIILSGSILVLLYGKRK